MQAKFCSKQQYVGAGFWTQLLVISNYYSVDVKFHPEFQELTTHLLCKSYQFQFCILSYLISGSDYINQQNLKIYVQLTLPDILSFTFFLADVVEHILNAAAQTVGEKSSLDFGQEGC